MFVLFLFLPFYSFRLFRPVDNQSTPEGGRCASRRLAVHSIGCEHPALTALLDEKPFARMATRKALACASGACFAIPIQAGDIITMALRISNRPAVIEIENLA
jgi:hypothetical protein